MDSRTNDVVVAIKRTTELYVGEECGENTFCFYDMIGKGNGTQLSQNAV